MPTFQAHAPGWPCTPLPPLPPGRCDYLNNKNTIFGKVVGDTIYNTLRLNDVEVSELWQAASEPSSGHGMCASVMHLTEATVATVLGCVYAHACVHGCVCKPEHCLAWCVSVACVSLCLPWLLWVCYGHGYVVHWVPTAHPQHAVGWLRWGVQTVTQGGKTNTLCVCGMRRQVDEDDRPVDPPLIKSIEVLWNPFDDIVPRTTPQERQAQEQFM